MNGFTNCAHGLLCFITVFMERQTGRLVGIPRSPHLKHLDYVYCPYHENFHKPLSDLHSARNVHIVASWQPCKELTGELFNYILS